MKKSRFAVIVILGMGAAPVFAVDVTANVGIFSEYIFRGIPQSDGKAAASGGIDVAEGGFYAGTWGSTVDDGSSASNDGLEIDWYGGYEGTVGEFGLGIGATWYTYTDDFDDEYLELNLSGSWEWFTLDIATGKYDNFGGPALDYQHYQLTGQYNGIYGIIGKFEGDFDGEYYEAGYGSTLSVNDADLFDYSISILYSSDDLLGGEDDINISIGVTKSFDLYSN